MKLVLLLILIAVVLFAAYVRLAPTDPDRWNVTPQQTQDTTTASGAVRVLTAPREDFERLDQIIRATPRTKVIAGSLSENRITYVTRSALWGFPDYTTVDYAQGRLRLFGRLRFGQADLGVNAARLERWTGALR